MYLHISIPNYTKL